VLLYLALGAQSLCEHADAIARPLREGHLAEARLRVGDVVSRETSGLDESGVAKAGVESVLENGNDAIFGALFWFTLLGGPAPCCSASPTRWTRCGATVPNVSIGSAALPRALTMR
jgi:cobalamin biosynthesis protein CobD/CbiB